MQFDESVETVTLTDDDGREIKFAVLEILEVKSKTYALLADAENLSNEDVLLVSVEGESFNLIEDTEEFDMVVSFIKSKGN